MTVYVDDMQARVGRLLCCHMVADDDAELHTMAALIGVQRRWHQAPPRHDSHYDVCMAARSKALRHGAVPIPQRTLALMSNHRRRTGEPLPTPERALELHQQRMADRRALEAAANPHREQT